MLDIYPETIIYVLCPSFNKTGGTELEHQLVHEINKLGVKSYITYYGGETPKINPAFKKYVNIYKTTKDIIDSYKNILIIPEIKTDVLYNYKKIQKCIWWMSVDNYLKRNSAKSAIQYFGYIKTLKHVLTNKIHLIEPKLSNDVLHLYQSEYAHQFLISKGIENSSRLSDYINDDYMESVEFNSIKRRNRVLYNPKKGIKYTEKLISEAPEIDWFPIENLTTYQVKELLRTSKVYVDFGNHPGKDRFPREAAISGCCILTNKKGSAKFFNDVPIPKEYKFEDNEQNIPIIINKIKECLINYDNHIDDFSNYRSYIKKEKDVFISDVKELFSINS